MEKPDDFEDIVKFVAQKLKDRQYAIRGTASLVLQGLDFNVGDVDVLMDKRTALYCNKAFVEIMTNKVEFSETEKYRSYYGKFKVNNVLIDVYGDWQIKKGNYPLWSSNYTILECYNTYINSKEKSICPLMMRFVFL